MLLLLPLYGFKVDADGSCLFSGEDDATASETALRRVTSQRKGHDASSQSARVQRKKETENED